MNKPNFDSHKKGVWVVSIMLLTIAVSGYFMGLRQTSSTLKMTSPVSVITADSIRRSAEQTNIVPLAVSYSDQDWLKHGRNAHWTNTLTKLVQPGIELSALTNISEMDREAALKDRSARRAYNGAPPVVPHPIQQDSSAACLACHAQGLAVKNRFASRISHTHYANCTQCHVPAGGPRIPLSEPALREPLAMNLFAGDNSPLKGERAWPKAPPTIPHPTLMRSDCMSCHGSAGLFGLRTPHPDRQSCTQCHAPNADLDQRRFFSTLQPELSPHSEIASAPVVGQAFQPAGLRGFPAPCPDPLPETNLRMGAGDWKAARTGRLESLPYIRWPRYSDSTSEFGLR